MSKEAASHLTYSHFANLKSPPPNVQAGIDRNGSALPFHTASPLPNGLKVRDEVHVVDPDEIFAKHTVHEVKSILHRLRSDVDAKQEELRLMVGERYRDLLQASTSIIAMSQSSKKVVNTVARMKCIVSTDLQADNISNKVGKDTDIEDGQLKIYQCLAAHLRFLVDAPEHLWRLLERKQCLHAAWLFLLSRVVYRSLMNEDSDEGRDWTRQGIQVKEQFPLIQRQWETVSQFRAQIAHKATLSLREQDLKPQELCASMFSVHLLDSLPLSDALDVFLKQRSRSLQTLYQSINESWEKRDDPSVLNAERSGKDSVKSVWDAVRLILGCIVGTVGNARAVFEENADGPPSMISEVLAFTQSDSPQTNTRLPPELCLSSHALIFSLPSSNHFLALPLDIKSYRPFIDLASQSARVKQDVLNAKLRGWFSKATEHFHESSGSWLTHLKTVKTVWELRASAMDWISTSGMLLSGEETESLRLLVDEVCRSRVQDIWKAYLGKISYSFRDTLQSFSLAIAEAREDTHLDMSPAEFLLSAPLAPSVTQVSLNVFPLSQSSFQRFKHGIQQRIDGVTPFIERIVSEAESSASDLRDDLRHAFVDDATKSLEALFVSDSEKAASDLLASIESALDADIVDTERAIRHSYFMGRVAQMLALSPLNKYLRCSSAFGDSSRRRALRIYESCVDKCASIVALSARDEFLRCTVLKSHVDQHTLELPPCPSPAMMDALLSLAGSVEKFAQFKDEEKRSSIARNILAHFSIAVVETTRQTANRSELRLVSDLYYLKAVCDDWGGHLSESIALLDEAIKCFYQSLPSDIKEAYPKLEDDVQRAVSESISHVRLLLSPLVVPSVSSSSAKSPKSPPKELSRQKNISSSFGGDREMQPCLNLVKPSARFGLLWVASTADQ